MKQHHEPALRLGDATYERLRRMILEGKIATGTALKEKRLSDMLSVSRTPVREAINRLISDGLVVREAGLTPVVRRLSVDDFVEILHIRRLLEVEAVGRAAERGGTAEMESLRAKFVTFRDGPQPDFIEQFDADERLHSLVGEQAGSRHLAELIRDLRMKTRIFDAARVPDRLKAGSIEHIEIIDGILARDPERAQSAMRAHIDNVRASVLTFLRRLF